MQIKMINKIVLTVLMAYAATAAYAVRDGFYFGAQLGQTNIHSKPATLQASTTPLTYATVSPKSTGVGERLFIGYNINEHAGIEGGITHYASATYRVPGGGSNPQQRLNSFEFLGKGMFPFDQTGISLFGKAGVSYARSSSSRSLTTNGNSNTSSSSSFRPALGVGVSYDLSQNWVVDLSANRVLSGGGIQNADFVALGISYHIVDKYCGQFLC